jgi:hypothetical protein
MNFTFIIDEATIFCLVVLQDTTPPRIRKMYLEVDFLVSVQPAKS